MDNPRSDLGKLYFVTCGAIAQASHIDSLGTSLKYTYGANMYENM